MPPASPIDPHIANTWPAWGEQHSTGQRFPLGLALLLAIVKPSTAATAAVRSRPPAQPAARKAKGRDSTPAPMAA